MPTIDLSAPSSAPEAVVANVIGTLEGLPRRLALTLVELQYLAVQAGDAPLPFDVGSHLAEHPQQHVVGDLLPRRLQHGEEATLVEHLSELTAVLAQRLVRRLWGWRSLIQA